MIQDSLNSLGQRLVTIRNNIHPNKLLITLSIVACTVILAITTISVFPRFGRYLIPSPASIVMVNEPRSISVNETVWVMIQQVSLQRVMNDLRVLTGSQSVCLNHKCYTIANRVTGSEGLRWAEDYIVSQLKGMGYSVQSQEWSLNGYSDRNLVIEKTGSVSTGNQTLFVAHLDGEACPAADDNASGVAALLELARIIHQREFSSTIVLLFSTGEEQDALGVTSYLETLAPEELATIKYVVNVDMIGYDANKDGAMELFNGTQPLDFVERLYGIVYSYHFNLKPEIYSDCG